MEQMIPEFYYDLYRMELEQKLLHADRKSCWQARRRTHRRKGGPMIAHLYQLFFQELAAYITGMTKDRSRAEDIVQEAFLRAMEHASQINEMQEAQCRSWLYRTARNIFIDKVRRDSRETALPQEDTQEGCPDDLSRVEVMQLICQLTEEEKSLFIKRYFEGYDSTQLGAMYSLPPSTIRYRLLSARKKLRKLLSESEHLSTQGKENAL